MLTHFTRQRSKIGCLYCRSVKRKCDETKPICKRCLTSGRQCKWPAIRDLVDRRHTPAASQVATLVPTPEYMASIVHRLLLSGLEPILLRHFGRRYGLRLFNPECNSNFLKELLESMQRLLPTHQGLRYTVLANAASHLFLEQGPGQLQELALDFYSQAMRAISRYLSIRSSRSIDEGTRTAIVLLGAQGLFTHGTSDDVAYHVIAAVHNLKLTLLKNKGPIDRPRDVIAVESVLFQAFLLTMGYWSDKIDGKFQTQSDLWDQCERLLEHHTIFSNRCTLNSPVLGLPLRLYRNMIQIKMHEGCHPIVKNQFARGLNQELNALDELTSSHWQTAEHRPSNSVSDDIVRLFLLEEHLLVDQLLSHNSCGDVFESAKSDSLRLREIVSILEERKDSSLWEESFLVIWPVYTAGWLLSAENDCELVRQIMGRILHRTKFTLVRRLLDNLKHVWVTRANRQQVVP